MKTKKRMYLIVLCFMMLFAFSASAQAKPSKAKVKKAYQKYISKNLYNLKLIEGSKAFYRDLNNDGVLELCYCYNRYSATRPDWIICTYKRGKVVKAGGFNGFIEYNKKKKVLQINGRAPWGSKVTYYRLSGSKLKLLGEYRCVIYSGHERDHYVKNSKEIGKKKFEKELSKYRKWKWKSINIF